MITPILMSALVTALVGMLAFPETPAARGLHRWLVEPPARFLSDFSWRKLGLSLLVGAAFALLMLVAPEIFVALGVSTLDAAMLELLFAATLAGLSGNLTGAWRTAKRTSTTLLKTVRRIASTGRARSPRRPAKRRPPRHEDPDPTWAFA